MDDKRYLLSLIREGEHQQQDFKYRVSDACNLAKSVSAFANTDGGRLLIGVRDDGHLSGVRSEEEIFMMHQAAYKFCKPEPSIKFDTFHVDGRTIVIATVPPSDKRPVCAQDDEGRMRGPTFALPMRISWLRQYILRSGENPRNRKAPSSPTMTILKSCSVSWRVVRP